MRALLAKGIVGVAMIGSSITPGTADARPTKPVIVSLSITRAVIPAVGGQSRVTARVRGAKTCHFLGLPGGPRNYRCASGRTTALFTFPRSTSPSVQEWDSYLELVGPGNRRASRKLRITQASATIATPPPVELLDACDAGPHCFYGPIFNTYPTYGNAAPAVLGDCTFAAVANWEQIVMNHRPDPTQIGYEFADAGGTEAGGLAQNSVWTYWRQHGIGGLKLTALQSYFRDQTNVENVIQDYTAAIAELRFVEGTGFAQYTVGAGLHDVVVDGYTPEGPLVVSWRQTLQMTWEQWDAEAIGFWAANAAAPG
jgi:hypothetical protein